ncbi:MAG: glycoside hydrolase family 125 protein, partial [Mucilaginibacter polytrichastri]|nr:glycoside hydrolase family 125 protein [Mucilaginibacter polytrichastri]
YPVKPVGLICSMFRPSDDATIFAYLVPSNFFAVVSLKHASEMMRQIAKDEATASELAALGKEVEAALKEHAIVEHPKFGKVYAYEVNGFGSYNLMDDANIPSLLALPYLEAVPVTDPIYQNTRKLLLSAENPFFFKGKAAEGIGGPHIGKDMIWPMSLVARGLTSTDDNEIRYCIQTLQKTHGGTGFMHESFHKDDPTKFTRKWFAWANTIFGEFLWKTYKEKPALLG